MKRARKGPKEGGFSKSGNAFEKHVASGQQANQYALDDVVLAYDDFGNFPANSGEPINGAFECRFRSHVFHCRARQREKQDEGYRKIKATGVGKATELAEGQLYRKKRDCSFAVAPNSQLRKSDRNFLYFAARGPLSHFVNQDTQHRGHFCEGATRLFRSGNSHQAVPALHYLVIENENAGFKILEFQA